MLLIAVLLVMTAVALPHIRLAPVLSLRTASLALLTACALSISAIDSSRVGVSLFNGLYQSSPVSLSVDALILVAGAVALVPWAPHTVPVGVSTHPTQAEYAVLVLFSTCGSLLLCASSDLVTLYLSVEMQSFAVYVLCALYRDSESATGAGLQYLMLGGLSSSLILLGAGLVYAHTGLTGLDSILSLLSVGGMTGMEPCALGLVLIGVGLLFKVAAAPFHQWAPDVYDGVPTIVTTWIGVMPKLAVVFVLLELSGGLTTSLVLPVLSTPLWSSLMLLSALLSLVLGTVVGLAQSRLKRLLSYSTISHVGFLLMALTVNTQEGSEAFMVYLAQYTATSLLTFQVVLGLGYGMGGRDVSLIRSLAGQGRLQPLLSLTLAVCLFSMAGVPPLVGFFAKLAVLQSTAQAGYTFMTLTAIVASVISASYYLYVVRVLQFDSPLSSSHSQVAVGTVHSYVSSLLTLAIVLFALQPSLVLDSATLLALCLHTA
jgi:NADH-ubiquinone oxidoreductase chain 2